MRRFFLLLSLCSLGCADGDMPAMTPGDDADDSPDMAQATPDLVSLATVYPAWQPEMPQVQNLGGPVQLHPRWVPIFFHDFDPDRAAKVISFLHKYAASDYFTSQVGEYGAGSAVVAPPIMLPDASPANTTSDAIATWLQGRLDGTHPEFGTPTLDNTYTIFYSSNTQITRGNGEKNCVDFGGYHGDVITASGKYAPYAVVSDCYMGTLDDLTVISSHELYETATDPMPSPSTSHAYDGLQARYYLWSVANHGAEIGDLCEHLSDANYTDPTVGTFQRAWSNRAAQNGSNPCWPATGGDARPFFNSVPVFPGTVSINGADFDGVEVPVGMSATVDVHLWSNRATSGAWTVKAAEIPASGRATLSFSWDKTSGRNGDVLHLKISAKTPAASGYTTFTVTSTLGLVQSQWSGVVSN